MRSVSCCTSGLDDLFSERVARHDANRYRKRGLPPRARKLIRAVEAATTLSGKRILEIGVGVGGLTIELLRRGAAAATGVDAVENQLAQARSLAEEKGVADRLKLVHADFAAAPDFGDADIVLLDRVVCCYPDWHAMLDAAASRARIAIAMTYPRDVRWLRLGVRVANFWQKLTRSAFRLHVHPPAAMHALLRQHGLTPRVVGRYYGWEILTAVRLGERTT